MEKGFDLYIFFYFFIVQIRMILFYHYEEIVIEDQHTIPCRTPFRLPGAGEWSTGDLDGRSRGHLSILRNVSVPCHLIPHVTCRL